MQTRTMNRSARWMLVGVIGAVLAADIGALALHDFQSKRMASPMVVSARVAKPSPAAPTAAATSQPSPPPAPEAAAAPSPTPTPAAPRPAAPAVSTGVVARGAPVSVPRAVRTPAASPARPNPATQPKPQPAASAANRPPVLPAHDWNFSISRNETLTISDDRFIRDASDPDGGSIYFVAISVEGPVGNGSNDCSGHISVTPAAPGTIVLSFQVQDDAGANSAHTNRVVVTVS
jgi:hypothetical protein